MTLFFYVLENKTVQNTIFVCRISLYHRCIELRSEAIIMMSEDSQLKCCRLTIELVVVSGSKPTIKIPTIIIIILVLAPLLPCASPASQTNCSSKSLALLLIAFVRVGVVVLLADTLSYFGTKIVGKL